MQSIMLGPLGSAKVAAGIAAGAASLLVIDRIFSSMGEEAGEAATKIRNVRTEMDELASTKDRKFGGRFGIRKAKEFLGLTNQQEAQVIRSNVPRNRLRNPELEELREQTKLMREMMRTGGFVS